MADLESVLVFPIQSSNSSDLIKDLGRVGEGKQGNQNLEMTYSLFHETIFSFLVSLLGFVWFCTCSHLGQYLQGSVFGSKIFGE